MRHPYFIQILLCHRHGASIGAFPHPLIYSISSRFKTALALTMLTRFSASLFVHFNFHICWTFCILSSIFLFSATFLYGIVMCCLLSRIHKAELDIRTLNINQVHFFFISCQIISSELLRWQLLSWACFSILIFQQIDLNLKRMNSLFIGNRVQFRL